MSVLIVSALLPKLSKGFIRPKAKKVLLSPLIQWLRSPLLSRVPFPTVELIEGTKQAGAYRGRERGLRALAALLPSSLMA